MCISSKAMGVGLYLGEYLAIVGSSNEYFLYAPRAVTYEISLWFYTSQ